MVNLYERHRWHLDPNRPPMTPPEVATLSQTIGGLKRSKKTIANARQTLSRYEDKSEKPSDSGLFINTGLNEMKTAIYWLEQAISMLESGRDYAKKGK